MLKLVSKGDIMKKKYLLTLFICLFLSVREVYALGLNLWSSATSITKGNSAKISVTVSSNNPLFFIEGTLKCTGAGVNGGLDLKYDNMDNNIKSKSYSYSIKPTSSGVVTCSVSGLRLTDSSSDSWQNINGKSITIKVNEPVAITPKTYSSNNYLSSLEIENYKFDSDFNKETDKYVITLPSNTQKIKINASKEDSKASVSGIGEFDVSEGINTFLVIVTAENGNKRTYTLEVNVLELEPITVKVSNNEYTVVRKRKGLPKISEYFNEKDILIDEEMVEGYYYEKLNYSLVGLKDNKGNIEYYIYNNGKYTLYKEYTFGKTTLQVLDKELERGYKKTSFTYDGDKIDSYQEAKPDIIKSTYALNNDKVVGNQFYLFYAKNLENGVESLYQYDALEKTIQRYNIELLDVYKDVNNIYYLVILGLVVFIILLIIIYSLALKKAKRRGKKKKLNKHTMDFDDDDE